MGKFKRIDTSIDGVCIVEPTVFGDNRGYFMETYSKADFEEIGLNYDFVQDNQSKSKKGVLRGLHFQKENTQAKLVRCIKGEVFDVAVDLRPGSKTYGKWEGVILTEENKKMFMIPKGFAHGFLVLSDEAEFAYKCDDIYNHEAEGGLKFDDPDVAIEWPMRDLKPEDLLTSEKDGKWPSLKELKETGNNYFVVCLTNGSYDSRARDFDSAMNDIGAKHVILRYPDLYRRHQVAWDPYTNYITQDIRRVMNYRNWSKIVTHNPDGEYGHQHHKKTDELVTAVSHENAEHYDKLYYFEKFYTQDAIPEGLAKLPSDVAQKKHALIFKNYFDRGAIRMYEYFNDYENWVKATDWQ